MTAPEITTIESANGTTIAYPLADGTMFVTNLYWGTERPELNIVDSVNTDYGTPTFTGARLATWDECPEPVRYEIQDMVDAVLAEWAAETNS